ncbi:glycerophosphoryl diester phosphodiesterase [Paenibacillus baekrokdamisoli]|uniref:Glycerophosphoryl diester phosphodiesterase n=1 Tax=Paenibacillus baekrokdamisoli TaxID=1712516 RepID=A0A3G9J242_9BACL|nr:glycerophosphodiester phosphodiesterase [Paenibacillus baekrokdamisoli]MBB3069275.1 glycerophosphoryl diester phosphodiesterase [Paenibacillus baekrokdamisoli]BBH18753.1 glycerophosphoryl diester phosphodiesterase [Paenibacillus baekrokdamisoli]
MSKASKTPIHKLIADIFKTLAFTYRQVFIFELLYKTLTLFIFIPAISFIFHRLIRLGGFAGATNYEMLHFVVSRYGFLCMLILIPVATMLIFLEFSVLVIIAYYGQKKQRIGLIPAFLQSLAYLPSLFKYGFVGWALYLILFLPLLSLGLGSSLLPSLQIPNFISGELFKTGRGTLLYAGVFAVVAYFNIRWTFLLHMIVIEGTVSFRQAAKKSAAILKKSYFRMFVVILCISLLFLIVVALIFGAVTLVYFTLPQQTGFAEVVRSVVSKSAVLSLYLATLFVTPLYITILTRMYTAKADPSHAVLQMPDWNAIENRSSQSHGLLHKHKRKLIVLGLIIAFATALVLVPAIGDVHLGDKKATIMAHRGYTSKGPENTIAAIQGAIEAHADFAEIDVLETKDGELAVIHDTNLKRLTGRNAEVYDLTMDELRKLEVKQGNFTGRISSLAEVMNAARGKIKLNIEVKTHGKEHDLVNTFIRTMRENDFQTNCVVQSLDYEIVQKIKAAEPELQVGYIMFAGVPDIERIHADFVVMEEYMVNESVVASAKLQHKPLYVWTVNEMDSMERFFSMGVDGIITDYPEDAISLEQELHSGLLASLLQWLNNLRF